MGTAIAAAYFPHHRPSCRCRCRRRSRSRPASSDKTTRAIMLSIMTMVMNDLTLRSVEDATRLQDVQGNAGTGRPEQAAHCQGGSESRCSTESAKTVPIMDGKTDPSSTVTMACISNFLQHVLVHGQVVLDDRRGARPVRRRPKC
jgi:hypothetical protein